MFFISRQKDPNYKAMKRYHIFLFLYIKKNSSVIYKMIVKRWGLVMLNTIWIKCHPRHSPISTTVILHLQLSRFVSNLLLIQRTSLYKTLNASDSHMYKKSYVMLSPIHQVPTSNKSSVLRMIFMKCNTILQGAAWDRSIQSEKSNS